MPTQKLLETAIGLRPGAALSSGTTSLSNISASGSGRVRPRWSFFWKARVARETVAGRGGDAGLGGRRGHAVGLSEVHEEPHLLVGDMAAGHGRAPTKKGALSLCRPTAITGQPHLRRRLTKNAGGQLRSGRTALPASPTGVRLSS